VAVEVEWHIGLILLLELVLHYFGVKVVLGDLVVVVEQHQVHIQVQMLGILVVLEMILQLHHRKEILVVTVFQEMEVEEVVVPEEVVLRHLRELLASEEPI
jgi:hypothetical protein